MDCFLAWVLLYIVVCLMLSGELNEYFHHDGQSRTVLV